jgi:divalent metal cation (Fe/Co/Zn/Cd) transporter
MEKYKDISERLLMYITVIGSFAIVECMIGLSHANVHIVRDSLNVFLMLVSLIFSSKALQLSQKPKDEDYPYGYRRFNIMAAFVNTVYLLFSVVFCFVDNLHHMLEHWESESHGVGTKEALNAAHADQAHLKEVNQYLTLFTFLKLVILASYLYFETRNQEILDYMQVNWLGWTPAPGQTTEQF